MSWVTFYLKADSEADLRATLPDWMKTQSGDLPLTDGIRHALDWFGTLVHEDAELDPETGEMLADPVITPGFHANLRLKSTALPESLEAFVIDPVPSFPKRCFLSGQGCFHKE